MRDPLCPSCRAKQRAIYAQSMQEWIDSVLSDELITEDLKNMVRNWAEAHPEIVQGDHDA